jgi:predicted hotdog family 3-hydroxylacyl-ACP dehydratase
VTLPIDRAAIAALIPHAGAMCLLDGVLAWNRTSIACRASSQPGAGRRPAAGYLASLRDVVCSVDRLDRLEGDLLVTAELLIADAGRVIYRFNVTCDDRPVLSGRAAVVIDAGTAA